jgi:hypothetical protein
LRYGRVENEGVIASESELTGAGFAVVSVITVLAGVRAVVVAVALAAGGVAIAVVAAGDHEDEDAPPATR